MDSVPTGRTTALPRKPDQAFVPCRMVGATWFERAPVRLLNSVELPISRARLFEIFADAGAWPQWVTGIGNVEWTSAEPHGPGTTRTVTFWGGVSVYEEFFVYDPEAGQMSFCFYGTTKPLWTSFAEDYRVTELMGGRCRLDWTVAYEPAGILARIHGLVAPVMAFAFASFLWRLRRYVRRVEDARDLGASGMGN